MCEQCGCSATPGDVRATHGAETVSVRPADRVAVEVLTNILHENDHQAAHNREHFRRHGVLAVNLMSSPGSGKTSLLEATIDAIGEKYRLAVIEGDLETENDARRIRAKGVPAVQITTGNACHLDARMVHDALHALDLAAVDILFVENVGNLVCPAIHDLGQHANVVALSVTEGPDKPLKYPGIVAASDLLVISKADLLPHLDLDLTRLVAAARRVKPDIEILTLSAKTGEGLDSWYDWIDARLVPAQAAE